MFARMSVRARSVFICGLVFLSYIVLNNYLGQCGMKHALSTLKALDTYIVDTPTCIPDYDPFDISIRNLTKTLPKIQCPESSGLTYMDRDYLRINRTVSRRFYVGSKKLRFCQYTPVLRSTDGDKLFEYDPVIVRFKKDVKITTEFIKVECFNSNGTRVYHTWHAVVCDKPVIKKRCEDNLRSASNNGERDDVYSILLVILDSTSRLVSKRHLQRTRDFLLKQLHGVELNGYNKVEHNSFVNIIPLLTGKHVSDTFLHRSIYNNLEQFWKKLSSYGHRTMFLEEGYPAKEFFSFSMTDISTDYYIRPLLFSLYDDREPLNASYHCIGAAPDFEFYLRYMADFVQLWSDTPFFSFTQFNSDLIHGTDSHNGASVMDDSVAEFFERLYRGGHLNRTFVMLGADHGPIWQPFILSELGAIESLLPMSLVVLPEEFQRKHPEMFANLKNNGDRLTSHFDVYQTMRHLMKLDTEPFVPDSGTRGMSLFQEVPRDRTCEQMGIAPQFCACQMQSAETTPAQQETVQRVANITVTFMNNQMMVHNGLCSNLTLLNVIQSKMITSIDKSEQLSERITKYRLIFQTSPGLGEFRALVKHLEELDSVEVLGDVERINMYRNQSHCVGQHHHKTWCYCVTV